MALGSLAATLGSHDEISRLRFCFEHVTFESSPAPYSPGDDPWRIAPGSPEAAARIDDALAGTTSYPPLRGAVRRIPAALARGGELPVTLADARRSLELVTALYYSAATGTLVSLPIGAAHPYYRGWHPRA